MAVDSGDLVDVDVAIFAVRGADVDAIRVYIPVAVRLYDQVAADASCGDFVVDAGAGGDGLLYGYTQAFLGLLMGFEGVFEVCFRGFLGELASFCDEMHCIADIPAVMEL